MAKPEETEKTSLVVEEQEPQVSVAEFESLSAQVAELAGEIQAVREEIPEGDDNKISEIEARITGEVERIDMLEVMGADLTGKVEVLALAVEAFDVGTYNVEDFPYG